MRIAKQLVWIAVIVVISGVVNYGWLVANAAPVQQQEPTTFEGDLRVTRDMDVDRDLNVDDDAVFDDDVTVGGDAVISGALTLTGDLTASGDRIASGQSAVLAAGYVITPTAEVIALTSAAEVTSSTTTPIITTTATANQIIILQNRNASDAINLDGTGGSVECKANVALAPLDTLMLIYNGSSQEWNCLASYDNG